jgi:hypothetical protein
MYRSGISTKFKTHVNLNYMKKVGRNQFKWPKYQDLLLTQREDILTKCSAPIGSSFSTFNVGLWPSDSVKADAALELVVYLQPFLNIFFFLFLTSTCASISEVLKELLRSWSFPLL